MVKIVKNKSKRFRWKRIQWKKVISAALAVLLVVGAIAGIAVLASKDTKTISSFVFARGSIDANGNHVKTDTSIYTKDMFECQGLTIDPDFTAAGTYQVFYYATDEMFIGATEVMNANDPVYVKGDTFPLAKYCRVVITPDDGGDSDFSVKFYNVTSYANDYTITVNKKQKNIVATNVTIDESTIGRYFSDEQIVGSPLNLDLFDEMYAVSSDIDVKNASFVALCSSLDPTVWRCAFLDAGGNVVSIDYLVVDRYGVASLKVPKNACTLKAVVDVGVSYSAWILF